MYNFPYLCELLLFEKMREFKTALFLAVFATCLLFCPSCQKGIGGYFPSTDADPLAKEKEYLHELMTEIYYWYNTVPRVNASSYESIEEYFDALLAPEDMTRHGYPWSWMAGGDYWNSVSTGVQTTYGISIDQALDYYNDYSIRVRYVFPGSPMAENGVKRGYELTHLNDIDIMSLIYSGAIPQLNAPSNKFTFRDYTGNSFSFNASQRVVSTRSYLSSMVFTSQDYSGLPHNVGYFHYYTFNANMLSDIHNAMSLFNEAGIRTLILDLRYNGGGDTNALDTLANYIAPSSAEGKVLSKRAHNAKYAALDDNPLATSIIKRRSNALNLDRLIVLTTRSSASASEILINGLTPLMEVVQIGSTTYGKPNGMYVYSYPVGDLNDPKFTPDYIFLPVCFFVVNSEGYGNFKNGLAPFHQRPDDLYHDFGLEDDWIQASLQYISTGTFPALPELKSKTRTNSSGYRIKGPEEYANYVTYIAAPPPIDVDK